MTEGKAEPDAHAAGTMVGQSPNMGLGEEREGKVNRKHFGPIELGKKIIIQRKEQCDLIIANYYCNYYYCRLLQMLFGFGLSIPSREEGKMQPCPVHEGDTREANRSFPKQ